MKKHRAKAYLIGCAAAAAAGGAAFVGYAYYTGGGFVPRSFTQAIQSNQVLFGQDGAEQAGNEADGKSSGLWEKSPEAENTLSDAKNRADYLFESEADAQQQTISASQGESVSVASADTQEKSDALTRAGQTGLIYDLVRGENGGSAGADVILSGSAVSAAEHVAGEETSLGTSQAPSAAASGDDNRVNAGGGGQQEAAETSRMPDTGSTQGSGEKDAGTITPQPAPKPETEQETDKDSGKDPEKPVRPSDSARDPGGSKSNPSNGVISNGKYNESVASKVDKTTVIQDAREDPFTEALSRLYLGQTVTDRTVYNALNTYVQVDGEWTRYLWGDEDLGRYVCINRISFDGGRTWNSLSDGAEVTIPAKPDASANGVLIDVAYRLSVQDTWTDVTVSYQPEDSRILVLNQVIADENVIISDDMLVNGASAREQYLAKGEELNLYYQQKDYFGKAEDETLPALFAGWTENGNPVSWLYKADTGRHILEPGESVSYDTDSYTIKLRHYYLSRDGENNDEGELCYLQTLTGYQKKADDGSVLRIPYYVQALDLADGTGLEVDAVTVPDTVVYIDPEGVNTRQGWIVSDENSSYCSDENRLLYNKAETKLLGMPGNLEELEVSVSMEQIQIPENNALRRLTLTGTGASKAGTGISLPVVNLDVLSECRITLPAREQLSGKALTAFLREHAEAFARDTGNTLSFKGEDASYTVQRGFLIDSDGRVCETLAPQKTMQLPVGASVAAETAFADAGNLATLQMPCDGALTVFESGALENSSIAKIQCYTQEQQEEVLRQVRQQGLADRIQVTLENTLEINGFTCSVQERDGEEVLVIENAPSELTVFDETSLSDAGAMKVGSVAARAFMNCSNLTTAVLPESVREIGEEAFKGCTKLEGVLAAAQDRIYVGDGAFDGCSALRFAAFNAKEAVWENGYAPEITDSYADQHYGGIHSYLFAPSGASGYPEAVTVQFGEADDVDGYLLVPIGRTVQTADAEDASADSEEADEAGDIAAAQTQETAYTSLALCGGSFDGQSGELYPWLLVRSSAVLESELALPETILEIYSYAFADAAGESADGFSVRWGSLPYLTAIDDGAFCGSALAGEVSPSGSGMGLYVGNYAFAGCGKLTGFSSEATSYLGKYSFADCAALERVALGHMWTSSDLSTLTFSGDTALTCIAISNSEPFRLIAQEPGLVFYFAGKEEDAQIRLEVPEEAKDTYIRDWVMVLLGYEDYTDLYADVYFDMLFAGDFTGEAQEVHAACGEMLLASENRLRGLLGMETVSKLTYPVSDKEKRAAENAFWGNEDPSLPEESGEETEDTAAAAGEKLQQSSQEQDG